MVRRHQASNFAADVFVFPGGTVRADDRLEPELARAVGFQPDALHSVLAAHDDPFGYREMHPQAAYLQQRRHIISQRSHAASPDTAPISLLR